MLYLYDKAMKDKLSAFYPRVVYAPVDKFYQEYLTNNDNEKESQTKLPALSIWRISHEFNSFSARSNMNTPSLQTKMFHNNTNKTDIHEIFSMEIPLTYQLDIWAATDIDRDDMFTELMYALTLYPYITIQYQGVSILFSIMIENADDLTDIANFESTNDLYRMSIPLRVPDARLFFYKNAEECKHIKIDLSVAGDKNHDIIDILPK